MIKIIISCSIGAVLGISFIWGMKRYAKKNLEKILGRKIK